MSVNKTPGRDRNDKTNSNNRLRKRLKMISVDEANYNKLKQLGHVPDSFNTVVGRLIQEHYQR